MTLQDGENELVLAGTVRLKECRISTMNLGVKKYHTQFA